MSVTIRSGDLKEEGPSNWKNGMMLKRNSSRAAMGLVVMGTTPIT